MTDRLFEPFVQEEQQFDRLNGGLGLGLAISRKLAELQGGSLSGKAEVLEGGGVYTDATARGALGDDYSFS